MCDSKSKFVDNFQHLFNNAKLYDFRLKFVVNFQYLFNNAKCVILSQNLLSIFSIFLLKKNAEIFHTRNILNSVFQLYFTSNLLPFNFAVLACRPADGQQWHEGNGRCGQVCAGAQDQGWQCAN